MSGPSETVRISLTTSDIIEGGAGTLFFVGAFVVGYFLMSDRRIKDSAFVIAPYKRAHMLKVGLAFFFQAFFAMLMGIGFESVLSTLAQDNQFNFLNGIIIRDYRWISITIVSAVLAYAVASYMALPKLETIGMVLPTVIWGIVGFHLAHSTEAAQFYVLFFVGVAIILTMILVSFFETRTKFILSVELLIYIFFFGSLMADWGIVVFSNPWTNENNRYFGSIVPQIVYWVTKTAAALVIGTVGWWFFAKRVPMGDDLSVLYPYYDAVPNLVRAFLSTGVISWDKTAHKYIVTPGSLIAIGATLGPNAPAASGRTLNTTTQVTKDPLNPGVAAYSTYAEQGTTQVGVPIQGGYMGMGMRGRTPNTTGKIGFE